MAEATITLKLSTAEFDMIRAELMNRATDYQYGTPGETAKERAVRQQKRAIISEFLAKVNGRS